MRRDVEDEDVVFRLSLPKGRLTTLYLRLESADAMFLPITLWPENRFDAYELREQFGMGLFHGLIIAMGMVNLLVFFVVKDRNNLYFALLLFSLSLMSMAMSGFDQILMPTLSPWMVKRALPFFGGLVVFWASLFTRSFFKSPTQPPVLRRMLTTLAALALLTMLLALFLDYRWSTDTIITLCMIGVAVILASAIINLRRGFRPTRYFLAAWMIFLLSAMALALATMGVLPFFAWTENVFQGANIILALLMMLAMADRINVLTRSRMREHRRLINTQKKSLRLKRRMLKSISRFVPEDFLNTLRKDNIMAVKLGDSTRQIMAVMFSDIRNFTRMTTGMSPGETYQFLNTYLGKIEPAVETCHGFIDSYIGDGLLALFPADGGHAADHAIQAAIEMQRTLAGINRAHGNKGPTEISIGIHYGPLIMGTVGVKNRLQTTVIGDTVNVASRLEHLTRDYQAAIIISGEVKDALTDQDAYCLRPIGSTQVRGRHESTELYEVLIPG